MMGTHGDRWQRGSTCVDCGASWYYDHSRCPECGSYEWTDRPLGEGVLEAKTVARVTPEGVRDENPLGLARFDDGIALIAQLSGDDEEQPDVGERVRLAGEFELRDADEPVVGRKLIRAYR